MNELNIYKIFYSVEGETSLVGKPAVFVRLAGCNFKCSWCDTVSARRGGKKKKIQQILDEVAEYKCKSIVVTGGEPLMQKNSISLMKKMVDAGYDVILETNGSEEISCVPEKVKIILDIKTPSSGETEKMNFSNIAKLTKNDELKFVIANQNDFDWSRNILDKYKTKTKEILFSPVKGKVSFNRLADWVMRDMPQGRIQFNIQKVFSMQ